MRKLIRFGIFSTLLAMIAFTGCQKSNSDDKASPKGEPTSVKLSIKLPKVAATYSTTDPNATAAEVALETADIFIYEPPMGTLVNHYPLSVSDFSQVGTTDTYTTMNKLATTTGAKTVVVALNLPPAIRAILAAGSLSDVVNAQAINIAEVTNPANGFTMFSTVETNATFVTDDLDPANSLTIAVNRVSSKITLQKSATIDINAGGGTLMPMLTFTPRNSNRRIFYMQSLNLQDPNWAAGSWNATEFEQGGQDAGAPAYIPVNESSVVDPLLLNAQYAIENTSELHLEKETTYASVRGEYIPAAVVEFTNGLDASGGFISNNAHGITTPQTFYLAFSSIGERYYFFELNVATQYNTIELADFGPIYTYTDGFCYWNMFINPRGVPETTIPPFLNRAAPFSFLRNSYYKATITRILAPGNPTPFEANPEQPVQLQANITVTVDILPWALVGDDYELKP